MMDLRNYLSDQSG